MPIYEYQCQDCSTEFEKFVRSMTQTVEIECPTCGSKHVKKALSLFGNAKVSGGDGAFSSAAASCSPAGT